MSAKRIRILIVDDSELVRIGLRTLLESAPDIDLIGEAGTVADAITACERLRPDLVMLDLRLPDGTGFDACRAMCKRQPGVRVLILTSSAAEEQIDEAIRAGAHGYFLKEVHGQALIQAVRDVAGGRSILDPAIAEQIRERFRQTQKHASPVLNQLTPQDRKILALLAEGHTNKEIGKALGLAEQTIKNQLTPLFEKLSVSRRSQAAAFYVQHLA